MEDFSGTKRNHFGSGDVGKKKFKLLAATINLAIPDRSVSGLIGKHGSNVTQIEQDNGVKVAIEQRSDIFVGESLRKITVTGSSYSATTSAQRQISASLNELSMKGANPVPHPKGEYVVRLLVPNSLVSVLIGRKGSGIEQVVNISGGAYVSFCKKEEMPAEYPDRVLTLAGSLDQVSAAQEYASVLLSKSMEHLPHQRSRETPYQPQPYKEPQSIQMQSSGMNDLSNTSFMQSYLAGNMPSIVGVPNFDQMQNASYESFMNTQMLNQVEPSFVSQMFGSPSQQSGIQQRPSASKFVNTQREGQGEEIELMMYVPNSMVGVVIGKRGANIKDIISQCANNVQISVGTAEENVMVDFISAEPVRPIKLKGQAENAFMAQNLMQLSMHKNSLVKVNWIIAAKQVKGDE
mmetsp:Transcript_19943/g.27625  ORF Transcript_19943/g.27625 Transcript_19943/m.27625 type:complete len:406 (-) Transcript_19943:248-1465(-)|eukprot:CAMPEP_0196574084 /NCGR_PEP_ID=MMETSP1081-20130531/3863_1 /TAXON_ID=36882 /ORGANISM="Pyramimonas amylifera, Strain CCMP720" /LENGTH=405 /DNA_ID=CAMNT_0041891987 /DNA_START=61 /DNA_END=1278 /DNA_ORIENTATION=-